jgi:NAD(P)-dependent dehydrogenase (short-subunit alcohol dehydrogenase family)
MTNKIDLSGKNAVVTGGAQGIGRAVVERFLDSGAAVAIWDMDKKLADKTASELKDRGRVAAVAVDVTKFSDIERARDETVKALGGIHILVNNAGIAGPVAPLVDVAEDDWDEVFAVNVRGTFLMCRAFLPPMLARGSGDIVNLASVSGKRPLERRTPYCASKMAVLGLTSTLAFEVGGSGVRVNALSPGPVDGDRMRRNFTLEAARTGSTYGEAEQAFVNRAALGRMVTEDEVGQAAVAILGMSGLSGADVDLSAGMIA